MHTAAPAHRPCRPQAAAARVSEALACPCVADLKHGPCGAAFVTAFSCFHLSTSQPRGCDCLAANLAFAVSRPKGSGGGAAAGQRPAVADRRVPGCCRTRERLQVVPLGAPTAAPPHPGPPQACLRSHPGAAGGSGASTGGQ